MAVKLSVITLSSVWQTNMAKRKFHGVINGVVYVQRTLATVSTSLLQCTYIYIHVCMTMYV